MRSTGQIAGLGEALNAEVIATRCDRWEIDSFPAYFRTLADRHKKPFGMKASWNQLLMLLRWRFHEMHAGLRVVHIYRRDVIGQAISRNIAWQTWKWTSLSEVEHAVTPQYDATRIGQQITSIQREEGLFPLIFDAYDLPVVHVAYEDLVARPAAVVRSTMQAIGYPCPDWQRKPTRIKKQADATNDAFRARYRALLQRLCMGADRAD